MGEETTQTGLLFNVVGLNYSWQTCYRAAVVRKQSLIILVNY